VLVIALIVIGICLVTASVAAVFGDVTVSIGPSSTDTSRRGGRLRRRPDKASERAAMAGDQRGWWPGTPRQG